MQISRCIKCRHKEHFAKDLLEHMHREDHMDEPFVHCPQCKAAFEMEKIQSHYEECVSNTFTKCKWCDKIFSGTSGGLDIHRKKVRFTLVGLGKEVDPRLRESFKQVEAEVESNSSNRIQQTWGPHFSQVLF